MRKHLTSLALAALVVLAACNPIGHGTPKVTVASVEAKMAPYCARFGQVPHAWTEVDSDGNADVYGRCVTR